MSELELLHQSCLQCQKCPLGATRTNLVFGDGNPNAEIMFIGEGPGEQEDLSGVPFVGRAGQLLTQILEIIDLNRSHYYIANIVKCRPPHNRDPYQEEQETCISYLLDQIQLIQPKIIVCLGRIAACRLIRSDFKISKEHGQWVHKKNRWMTAFYHPSALLRDLSKRPETFDDLMGLQEKIMEICPDIYE